MKVETPIGFHGANMQLSEVMILYEEAVGSCLVPFWGAGSIPSIFEQGLEPPGHDTVMHGPFIPPVTAAEKITGSLVDFACCRLKINVRWTHKAGRQASLLFPLILGEGCPQVNCLAHSRIYSTAAEFQNCRRSEELI